MAVLLTTTAHNRLEPSDQAKVKEGERVAYLLATPTVHTQAAYLADFSREMRRAARDLGVEQLLADRESERATLKEGVAAVGFEDVEGVLARLAEHAATETPSAELQADFAEIVALVEERHPPFAEVLVHKRIALGAMQRCAVARFLVGWENVLDRDGAALAFARGPQGVPAPLLDDLSRTHIAEIYDEVERLSRPTRDEAKNLPSRSRGRKGSQRPRGIGSTRKKR